MKKLLAIFLAFALLTGCAKSPAEPNKPDQAPVSEDIGADMSDIPSDEPEELSGSGEPAKFGELTENVPEKQGVSLTAHDICKQFMSFTLENNTESSLAAYSTLAVYPAGAEEPVYHEFMEADHRSEVVSGTNVEYQIGFTDDGKLPAGDYIAVMTYETDLGEGLSQAAFTVQDFEIYGEFEYGAATLSDMAELTPNSISSTGGNFSFANYSGDKVMLEQQSRVCKLLNGKYFKLYDGDINYADPYYEVAPNCVFSFEENWGWTVGNLPAGEYSLFKIYETDGGKGFVRADFTVYGDMPFASTVGSVAPFIPAEIYPAPDGLSAELNAETLTPHSGSITVRNGLDTEVDTGRDFELFENIDGQWYELLPINDDALAFDLDAIIILPGDEETFEYDWSASYGALPDGEYALAKTLMSAGQSFENPERATDAAGRNIFERATVMARFTVSDGKAEVKNEKAEIGIQQSEFGG